MDSLSLVLLVIQVFSSAFGGKMSLSFGILENTKKSQNNKPVIYSVNLYIISKINGYPMHINNTFLHLERNSKRLLLCIFCFGMPLC
jgi:pilus assembly protein TadC